MRQYLKYSIIVILAALLHNHATEAAGFPYDSTGQQTESCVLSQAPTTWQTIQKMYDLFATTSLCIEYVDYTQVPSNKSAFLRWYTYKMQQRADSPECDRLLYLSDYPVPDAGYYIFGLRKILI